MAKTAAGSRAETAVSVLSVSKNILSETDIRVRWPDISVFKKK